MLQPGDILIVDLIGKKEGGTIVGDNLFYYVMKATKGRRSGCGRRVPRPGGNRGDGYARAPTGRSHPSAIGNVMLTGINVPVRIGNVTVMPGDLVVGDREGVYSPFIQPQLTAEIMDKADTAHVHDEGRALQEEVRRRQVQIERDLRQPARSGAAEGIQGVPGEAPRGNPRQEVSGAITFRRRNAPMNGDMAA